MDRQEIRDKYNRIRGYIEKMADGTQRMLDQHFHTVGYYDPKLNVTQDAAHNTIVHGSVLPPFIFDNPGVGDERVTFRL